MPFDILHGNCEADSISQTWIQLGDSLALCQCGVATLASFAVFSPAPAAVVAAWPGGKGRMDQQSILMVTTVYAAAI